MAALATTVVVGIFCPPAGMALGVALGGYEMLNAAAGKDLLSGRELGTGERWFRFGTGALGVFGGVKGLTSFSKNISMVKGASSTKMEHVVKMMQNSGRSNYKNIMTQAKNLQTAQALLNEKVSGAKSVITPEMEEKILWGQRKNPTKNEIIGGHSSSINNNHPNFATETIKINPDGTKDIKFVTQFPDGNLSKIKNSTVFPNGWSDTKILDSIKNVGNSPTINVRGRDGATWHRTIVDGVEIDVIKLGDNIVSGYPTGKVNAPIPGGFTK